MHIYIYILKHTHVRALTQHTSTKVSGLWEKPWNSW
jgi:hypothetical protein